MQTMHMKEKLLYPLKFRLTFLKAKSLELKGEPLNTYDAVDTDKIEPCGRFCSWLIKPW